MNNLHFQNIIKNKYHINLSINDPNNTVEFIPSENKISAYLKPKSSDSKEITLIQEFMISEIKDNVLEYHLLIKHKLLIVISSLKTIYFFNVDFIINNNNKTEVVKDIKDISKEAKLLFTYQHSKKLTGSYVYTDNNNKDFLIFSDKFGEIYLLDVEEHINNNNYYNENKEKNYNDKDKLEKAPKAPIYMLYGHADSISYIYQKNNTMISGDCFGKIKICEFPNVYEIKTVLIYENYFYVNYFSDKYILVLNNNWNINLWNLETLKLEVNESLISKTGVNVTAKEKTNPFKSFSINKDSIAFVLKDKEESTFYFKYNNNSSNDKFELVKEVKGLEEEVIFM